MRPVVGISLALDARGRWRAGREVQYLDAAYARVVEEAGGVPLLLPLQQDSAELIERLDGLLLPGGDDFEPPAPYPKGVCFDPAPARQIEFDRALLAGALEKRLPILGICYGMQLLALARGGALHYDLGTDLPEAGPHRLPERGGRHRIDLEPGSRLAGVLAGLPPWVNSRHHQAVAHPGAGLRVCARAEDGVLEAIEAPGADFCLAVQWHPERLGDPHRRALFGAFVAACRAAQGGGRASRGVAAGCELGSLS